MNLIAELKRRNVIRVGLAYLVLSWLLLQVGDVITAVDGRAVQGRSDLNAYLAGAVVGQCPGEHQVVAALRHGVVIGVVAPIEGVARPHAVDFGLLAGREDLVGVQHPELHLAHLVHLHLRVRERLAGDSHFRV